MKTAFPTYWVSLQAYATSINRLNILKKDRDNYFERNELEKKISSFEDRVFGKVRLDITCVETRTSLDSKREQYKTKDNDYADCSGLIHFVANHKTLIGYIKKNNPPSNDNSTIIPQYAGTPDLVLT